MVKKAKKIGRPTSIRDTMRHRLVENKNFSSQSLGTEARLLIKGKIMWKVNEPHKL